MNLPFNIFDAIRRNQSKLDERPSPRAWNRLEQRLNARRRKRFVYVSQQWSIAALVCGVVFFIALIIYLKKVEDQFAYGQLASLEKLHLNESPDHEGLQWVRISQSIYKNPKNYDQIASLNVSPNYLEKKYAGRKNGPIDKLPPKSPEALNYSKPSNELPIAQLKPTHSASEKDSEPTESAGFELEEIPFIVDFRYFEDRAIANKALELEPKEITPPRANSDLRLSAPDLYLKPENREVAAIENLRNLETDAEVENEAQFFALDGHQDLKKSISAAPPIKEGMARSIPRKKQLHSPQKEGIFDWLQGKWVAKTDKLTANFKKLTASSFDIQIEGVKESPSFSFKLLIENEQWWLEYESGDGRLKLPLNETATGKNRQYVFQDGEHEVVLTSEKDEKQLKLLIRGFALDREFEVNLLKAEN